MNKIISYILAFCLILSGCANVNETSENEKEEMIFACGGTGGIYYEVGNAVSSRLNDTLTDQFLTVVSTGGSIENIKLISSARAQICLAQSDILQYAGSGTEIYEDEEPVKGLRAIGGIYSEACHIIANKSIEKIEDLKGKAVSVGDTGSGTEFNAKQILEMYDISFDDIRTANFGFGESAKALKSGKIDAFFVTAGYPASAIKNLSENYDINILEIDEEHRAKLIEKYPFYTPFNIPEGTYNGVEKEINTVAVRAVLIASEKADEDFVYSVTSDLMENAAMLNVSNPEIKKLSAAEALEGICIPLHPGAERYYKEKGLV